MLIVVFGSQEKLIQQIVPPALLSANAPYPRNLPKESLCGIPGVSRSAICYADSFESLINEGSM